jgi:hypothetical protein
MGNIIHKKQENNEKTIDSAVARVAGAVQVAGVAVSATMAIKDQALDDVEALKTGSNAKAENHAIKKITKDTKRVLGKSK